MDILRPASVAGSPPLARGILMMDEFPSIGTRITPACAGNTAGIWLWLDSAGDHPRLRGEYQHLVTYPVCCVGSPPLARGIQRYRVARQS